MTGRAPAEVLDDVIDVCAADERILAAFVGGSHARGAADAFSDIDLCFVVADHAWDDVVAGRGELIRRLGEVLFLEDFGREDRMFAILADGTDLECNFVRVGALDALEAGPFRVLLDPQGILAGRVFPEHPPDAEASIRELPRILSWFWHELTHFTTALGRDELWWAAGQLEALRNLRINLERIHQGAAPDEEPYWKLDRELETARVEPLRATFVPIDRDALLGAGLEVVASFRERGRETALAHGLAYPEELDRLITRHLEDLQER
jgi:predicted nucleotidyltransferase